MSGKREKLIRKKVDQQVDVHIKTYLDSACQESVWERIKFGFSVLFKQLTIDHPKGKSDKIVKHYIAGQAKK